MTTLLVPIQLMASCNCNVMSTIQSVPLSHREIESLCTLMDRIALHERRNDNLPSLGHLN